MTEVVNLKTCPDFNPARNPRDVYIGRFHRSPKYGIYQRSKWYNPFKEGQHGKLGEVIELHRIYILGKPDLLACLPELKDKRLGCWCYPEPCHGDLLKKLVDQLEVTT
jgi:hypothetical protein